MLVKNAFEQIYELFPSVLESAIIKDIDLAQKELANDTNILTALGSLASPTANFAWTLPSDFLTLTDLAFYDSTGNPYYLGEDSIEHEIEFGKLYFKSMDSEEIIVLPSGISSAYLHYVKRPASITSLSDSFTIDEELHDGIVCKVLQKYFAKYPVDTVAQGQVIKARDWNAVRYYQGESNKFIRKGKILKSKKEDSRKEPIFYPHAGKIELPRRNYDSSVAIVIPGIVSSYSKYSFITCIEGQTSGTVSGTTGFGTITATISGNTITLVSTSADFVQGEVGIQQTNELIGWVITDAYTITMTADTGWLKTKIQLYVV